MAKKQTKKEDMVENVVENTVEETNDTQQEENVQVPSLGLVDLKNIVTILDTVVGRITNPKYNGPIINPSELVAVGQVRQRHVDFIMHQDPNWGKEPVAAKTEETTEEETTTQTEGEA